MTKIGIKFLNFILSTGLLLCITGCLNENQNGSAVESISQKEEMFEVESVEADSAESDTTETVSLIQPEETEATLGADVPEESEDIVKNDFLVYP